MVCSVCVLHVCSPSLASGRLRAPGPGVVLFLEGLGWWGEEQRLTRHNICYLGCMRRVRAKCGQHTQTVDTYRFLFKPLSLVKISNSIFWERVKRELQGGIPDIFSTLLFCHQASFQLAYFKHSGPINGEKKSIHRNGTNFTTHANTKELRERCGGETVWIHPLLLGCAKGFFFLLAHLTHCRKPSRLCLLELELMWFLTV